MEHFYGQMNKTRLLAKMLKRLSNNNNKQKLSLLVINDSIIGTCLWVMDHHQLKKCLYIMYMYVY